MQEKAEDMIAQDRGFLGTVTLYPTHLVIERSSVASHVYELLGWHNVIRTSRIQIAAVAGIDVIIPMILPPLLVVRYPGCSLLSGDHWNDAMLENVHMLSFLDHRGFDVLYRELERLVSGVRRRPAMADKADTVDPSFLRHA
ncbi:MAG: hypothetical protein HQ481_16020 [Alphaproteobacteria bacterium]|nr:hypothetical protein [Alphaproteobacteria bacterium]